MNEETKLPEGLELAETLCGHAFCADAYTEEQMQAAVGAIRAEHAQRLTLQHHAAYLAQRVADLEKERDEWQRLASAHSPAKELTTSLKRSKASGDAARKERDELRATLTACAPHLTEREDGTRYSPADMLALREREVLGLLGRLSTAQMLGDDLHMQVHIVTSERDELATGMLALRARLAELGQQEPVAWQFPLVIGRPDVAHTTVRPHGELAHLATPLYAHPVPATPAGWRLAGDAIPNGWKLVKVKAAEFDSLMYWLERCESNGHMEQCSDLIEPWYAFQYAEVAAPEHKA